MTSIKNSNLNNRLYITLLLVFGFFLILPLIDTKIIPGHDYVFHITRILDVAEALKCGIFPVRMYVDSIQFWGTPVGIFYPSLFNYFPAILSLFGLPIEICYNIYIALIIFSGLFASWCGFTLLTRSKQIGFYSTLLYISSGYYLTDTYIRNALGESMALSFMPLSIACINAFFDKRKLPIKLYILGILSISAVIESHVLSSIFLVLYGLIYLLSHSKKISSKIIKRITLILIALLLLNATFIVPFLIFYREVPLTIHFIEEFAQSGWTPIILLRFIVFWNFWLFTAIYFFFSTKIHSPSLFYANKLKIYSFYFKNFIIGVVFLFISSSVFPWDFLWPIKNVLKTMQFSWRFLGISTLFFCICGGFGLNILVKKIRTISIIVIVLVIGISKIAAFSYLTPKPFWTLYEKCYWERIVFSTDEDYLYKNMNIKELFEQKNRFITDAKITNWTKKITNISFSYSSQSDSKIILPLVNYPGYIALNQANQLVQIQENDNHMISISLPKGTGSFKVHYEGLPAFKYADYISLLSLMLLVFCIFIIDKKSMWKKLL